MLIFHLNPIGCKFSSLSLAAVNTSILDLYESNSTIPKNNSIFETKFSLFHSPKVLKILYTFIKANLPILIPKQIIKHAKFDFVIRVFCVLILVLVPLARCKEAV